MAKQFEERLASLELVSMAGTLAADDYFGIGCDNVPFRTRVINPVFVDDYAVPFFSHARRFFDKVTATTTCMWNTFRSYQLNVNMHVGKTALLPLIHGPGCSDVLIQIARLPDNTLPCPAADGGQIYLSVVKWYKHMGIRKAASGHITRENAARHATTRDAIGPLRVKLFKKTSIGVKEKAQVAGSVLLSRQFNGSGAWPALKTVERQRLHTNVLGVVRVALSEKHGGSDIMMSDAAILNIYEKRAPYAYVRFPRLRLSVRVVTTVPFGLLSLLHGALKDARSWSAAREGDLLWMSLCDKDKTFTPVVWFQYCRPQPKQARNIIRKYATAWRYVL